MPRYGGGAPLPFVPDVYEPNSTIAQMILRQGENQAQGQRELYGGIANSIGQIGQGVGQALEQRQQQQQETKQREALKAQDAAFMERLQRPEPLDPREIVGIYGPERGMKIAQGLGAFNELATKKGEAAVKALPGVIRGMDALSEPMRAQFYPTVRQKAIDTGLFPPESVPEKYTPEIWKEVSAFGTQLEQGIAAKTREIKTANPDGSETVQIVEDKPGFTATSAPKPKPGHMVTVQGPNGPIQRLASDEELKAGVPAYREPRAAPAAEPLVAIIGDDGKPVLAPRSQAVGKTPASNREQGRPVTSGDANRLTELTTSLDDVAKVRTALEGGATGAASKVGAMLPNVVTEFTGLGTESKATQATIDRVKQVIGKALEGGVLRKEDEAKYEKILPTIGDPAPVVKAKLDGLEKALRLRHERTLESLADAGYDTSRFTSRSPDAAPAKPRKKFNPATGLIE